MDNPVHQSRGIKDFDVFDQNPFTEGVVEKISQNKKKRIRKFITSKGSYIDNSSGEVKDVIMGIQKEVDSHEFTKLYHEGLNEIMGLTDKSSKILYYLASRLRKDQMQIEFDIDNCTDVTGYSKSSVYNAMAELLEFNIIARHKKSYIYFINPLYIFNGDRLTIVKQYVMPKKDKELIDDNMRKLGKSDFEQENNP